MNVILLKIGGHSIPEMKPHTHVFKWQRLRTDSLSEQVKVPEALGKNQGNGIKFKFHGYVFMNFFLIFSPHKFPALNLNTLKIYDNVRYRQNIDQTKGAKCHSHCQGKPEYDFFTRQFIII